MEIETDLTSKIPYLYHLTDPNNLERIIKMRKLYSTNQLFSQFKKSKDSVLYEQRTNHFTLSSRTEIVMIRDQRPLNFNLLRKTLDGSCTAEEFTYYLNERVFFWPNLERLQTHFTTYNNQSENVVIIKTRTADILKINERPMFCNINSGAPSRYHKPNWTHRNLNLFKALDEIQYPIDKIAEITFIDQCYLPSNMLVSSAPNGNWKLL